MKHTNKQSRKRAKKVPLKEIVGKTIARVRWTKVEGQYGKEPCVNLHFTDGTVHGFVLPRDEE